MRHTLRIAFYAHVLLAWAVLFAQTESCIAVCTYAASDDDTIQRKIHRLTESAKTAKDFTQIIDQCRTAREGELSDSDKTYLKSLESWALNRRCELRIELAEGFAGAGNEKQALRVRDEALADAMDAVKLDSTRWRALLNRGVLFADAGLLAESLVDFEAVCNLQPQESLGWFNRGEALAAQGNYREAVTHYTQAIQIDSADLQSLSGRGLSLCRLNDFEAALNDFEVVAKIRTNDLAAIINCGDARMGLGQWQQAYDDYIRAAKIVSDGIAAQRTAWLLATCPDPEFQKPEVALELAKHAIEKSGESTANLESLAAAHAANGSFSEAASTQRRAIEIAKTDDPARSQRLSLYEAQKPFLQQVFGDVNKGVFENDDKEVFSR